MLKPLLIATALLLGSTHAAHAYIRMEDTTPANKASLTKAPEAVVVRFTRPVKLQSSFIKVYASNGNMVGDGKAWAVDGQPNAMQAPLPATLPAGEYTVHWTVICHCAIQSMARGSFVFFVTKQ